MTIALATAIFTLGLYIAGSPVATAITFGLLMFGAIAITMIGWQDLKNSIVDEVNEARRPTMPGFVDHEGVQEHQPLGWSPRRLPVDVS